MKTRADDYTLIASPRNCGNRNLGTDGWRMDGCILLMEMIIMTGS